MSLSKFMDDKIFSFFIWMFFVVSGLCLVVFSNNYFYKPHCSDSQLHQVIAEVDECNKNSVICNEKMKNEIIEKTCN